MLKRTLPLFGLLLLGWAFASSAQDRKPLDPSSDARRKLAIAGFKAVMEEYTDDMAPNGSRQVGFAMVPVWSRRIMETELNSGGERIKSIQDHRDRLKQFAQLVRELQKGHPEHFRRSAVLDLEFAIMEAESMLAR